VPRPQEGHKLVRISVNSFAALTIAVSVYFLLASFHGLAQKFAFAVLNIVFSESEEAVTHYE